MQLKILACLSSFTLILAAPALAQDTDGTSSSSSTGTSSSASQSQHVEEWGAHKGDWEATFGAGGRNDSDFETGGFTLDGEVGYYVTDAIEVALRQSFTYSDFGSSSWSGSTRIAADYHFSLMENRLRPFVGANIGYFYGDELDEFFGMGPEAGVKYYVKEETFLFGRVEYDFSFEDAFDEGSWIYTLGIGFNF